MEEQMVGYRHHLVEARYKQQESFDRTLIALTSGAIGLSFPTSKYFADHCRVSSSTPLVLAWVFWGVALTVMLVSFCASIKSLDVMIERVDEYSQSQDYSLFGRREKWASATRWLNRVGLILFVLGLVTFVVFLGGTL